MPINPVMPFHIISLTGEATFAPDVAPVDVLPSGRFYIATYTLSWDTIAIQPYPFQRSFFSPYAWSAQYEMTLLLPQQESQFYLFGYTNAGVSMGSSKFTVHYATGVGWDNPLPENTPTRRDFLLGSKP